MFKKYKKLSWALAILLTFLLIYGINWGLKYAFVGSSYDAKTVCSCHFIAGRSLSNIQSEELYAIPFAHIEIDSIHQIVSADIYGLAKTKALYRKGLGCTLMNDATETELMAQSAPQHLLQSHHEALSYDSIPSAVDSNKLKKIIQDAFDEPIPDAVRRTRAVVILHQGHLIAEKYAPGFSDQTPLMGWSMTKSVTNAMIGMLVKDGVLKVEDPAPVIEWQQDERKAITLDHLMRMSSGLDFVEDYTTPSDATNMLFRAHGAGAFALTSQLKYPPGTVWNYSSGTSNILQEIIRRQFKSLEDYQAFPYLRLFDKIGMNSAVMEPDASGTFVGSSFMYATARDWARFGQLYLQEGVWDGTRILPEGWGQYSAKETPHSDGKYAAQFWINHQDKDFPQDAFFADGFEGQFVVIVPSKKLVIVRLGCTQGGGFDISDFVKKIVRTIPS